MCIFRRWCWATGIAVVPEVCLVLLSFDVVAPERALTWAVRADVPTTESMKRGDRNRRS
jgi:hypothetical protein